MEKILASGISIDGIETKDCSLVMASGSHDDTPFMTSPEEVEKFKSYKFYERIGVTWIDPKAILSTCGVDSDVNFNWITDWKIDGKPWWEVPGAKAVDSDAGCYLGVRTAKNGKLVYRVHKISGVYAWFEVKEKAIKFLYELGRN